MLSKTEFSQAEVNKLKDRIDALIEPVEAIVRGQKPAKYPAALFEQMQKMWDDDLLIDTPESYVTLPDEVGREHAILKTKWDAEAQELKKFTLLQLKGDTRIHPIPAELEARKRNIDNAAMPVGIRNYKVLGLDPFFRRLPLAEGVFDSHDPLDVCEDATAQILTRGDMHSLRQALYILRAKLDNDPRAYNNHLIIQNSQFGFWDPLLQYLGLEDVATEPALHTLNIHITQFPGSGESVASDSSLQVLLDMKDIAKQEAHPNRDNDDIQPGDKLYICSGSRHKPIQIADVFKEMRGDVAVQPLNSVISVKPREADEELFSAAGNDLDKLLEVRKRILEDIGYNEAVNILCGPRQNPENVWLVMDDRTLDFLDKRLTATKAFRELDPGMNPYPHKHQPGTELSPVLKMISKERWMTEVVPAAIKEVEQTTGETIVPEICDTACYMMVRLDWLLLPEEELKYIAAFGKTRSVTMDTPKPAGQTSQLDYFVAPRDHNNLDTPQDEWLSRALVPGFMERHSEIAIALRTLGNLMGVDKHLQAKKCATAFDDACGKEWNEENKFQLATLYTLFQEMRGHGIKRFDRVIKRALNGAHALMTGNSGRYNLGEYIHPKRDAAQSFERTNTKHQHNVDRALGKFRKWYADADGFLLTPDSEKLRNLPGIKWVKSLVYYSLYVGKQVSDQAITSKFFGIVRWNDKDEEDHSWDQQEAVVDHLNPTPLFGDLKEHMRQMFDKACDLQQALKRNRNTYTRPSLPQKESKVTAGSTPCPDDLYRVTIYCSATLSMETDAAKEAFAFTGNMAENGFALINGGGSREGLMLATSAGVHNAREKWRKEFPNIPMARNHVSSFQCYDTQEREGGWHPDNEFSMTLRNIEERMSHLQNTDAEILLAGGIGSIQEIKASMLMREWGLTPTRHRPLIIVNQHVDPVGPVFTPLIEMISKEERLRLNVHVVDTCDEALEILKQSRLAMAAEMKPGEIYVPKAANDNPFAKPVHAPKACVA